MRIRALIAAIPFLVLAACSSSSALRVVSSGDVSALKNALLDDLRQGRLHRKDIVELARSVAARELTVAKKQEAIQRIQQVRMCSRQLESELMERASGADIAAPEAAMALLQVGLGEGESWRQHMTDTDVAWRAVAVRTLTDPESGQGRQKAMLDPDETIRLAAVRASADAHYAGDLTQLFEVARLDPDGLIRVTAVRAIAPHGSADNVLRLKDLWANSPDSVRQAIVAAYAWPGMLENGGKRELIEIADKARGAACILAGGILLRLEPQTRTLGLAALLKHIELGTPHERSLAITLLPIDDPAAKSAIARVAKAADPEVKVAAQVKLAQDPKERAKALETLGTIAASGLPAANAAKNAMVRLHDLRVTMLLVKDGESHVTDQRVQGARGLVEIDDLARASLFLADSDVGVRTRTACEILRYSTSN